MLDARAVALADGKKGKDKVDAINAEIAAREKLAGLLDNKAGRDKSTRAFDDLMKADIGTNLSAGFDKASQSIDTFVETFGKLVDHQEQYNLARKAQGKTSAEIANLMAAMRGCSSTAMPAWLVPLVASSLRRLPVTRCC